MYSVRWPEVRGLYNTQSRLDQILVVPYKVDGNGHHKVLERRSGCPLCLRTLRSRFYLHLGHSRVSDIAVGRVHSCKNVRSQHLDA